MNNDNTNAPSKQLVLFSESQRATPVVNLDERIRSVMINGELHHSLLDILTYNGSQGSAANPSKYWKRAQDRILKQGGEVIPGLVEHTFQGQGQRATPVVNLDGFMRIVQSIDIPQWEIIREWMAKQAAQAIKDSRAINALSKAKINQGMSASEAQDFARQSILAKDTRNDWTAALQAAVIGAINYGHATNTEYIELFGKTARDIKEITGFKIARDGMTTEGRAIVTAVEATMSKMFAKHDDLTFEQALGIIRDVCAAYHVSVVNVERLLGIELSTGQKLLR